ncbi:MAG: hypothetical protein ABSF22_21565 [Bryobacteraceae bacterium]|jgi:hypothetical protein
MAVNKPRNRTLIFRLTQDEYDHLQAASSGARSLSDFARERLLDSIERPPIDQQLTELKTMIAALLETK